jgi:hypothetical protein
MYTSTMGPAAFVSDQFKKAKEGGLAFGADPKHGLPDFCSADFWNAAMQNDYVKNCSGFVNQQFPGMKPNPSACTAIQTQAYENRAESACRFSLNANLEGSKAAGKDLVGPDSAYCKAQKKLIEDNPCKLTGKTVVVPGSGQTFLDPTGMDCGRKTLPFDRGPGGVATIPQLTLPPSPGARRKFPGGTPSAAIPLPSAGGKAPPNRKRFPNSNRVGGVIQAPKSMRDAAKGLVGPGSGGSNSAMDRLGGLMGDTAIKGVSGNSSTGVPQVGGGRPRGPSGGAITLGGRPRHPAHLPSGVAGGPGSAPGGLNVPRRDASPKRAPSAPASSGSPDDLVEFGGCSSCNVFVQPK